MKAYAGRLAWMTGRHPLQPEARTCTLVGGVTTSTRPLNRGRRSA
jgi:hypothetical protein